jgi:hypothetical protein
MEVREYPFLISGGVNVELLPERSRKRFVASKLKIVSNIDVFFIGIAQLVHRPR